MSATEGLVAALRRRGETVAVAESCTGGGIGAEITSVPGASEVFWGGVISYDDDAKRRLLGVPAVTLTTHGAVSAETAAAMASGVRALARTTWSVAVTGIAGPGGGSDEKPVGTVWVGVDGPRAETRLHRLGGDRLAVRERAVREAIDLLASCVEGSEPNEIETDR